MSTLLFFYYLRKLLLIYYLLILLTVAFSWFRMSPYHPRMGWLVRLVRALTEPLLGPIRHSLEPLTWRLGGLDLSPLLLWLLLEAAYSLLRAIALS